MSVCRGSSASQPEGYQQAASSKQQSPPHFAAAVSPLKHSLGSQPAQPAAAFSSKHDCKHGQYYTFIRTVPMQHVQSHYSSSVVQPNTASKVFNTSSNCMSHEGLQSEVKWAAQVSAQPFAPLLSLSLESSSNSIDATPCAST